MERTPTFQIQSFGPYYLLERIAVGGMAEIFKAKHEGVRGFEKIVVIKKILHHLSEDPEFVEMFEDEARIASQLTQANIVQIYELGEIDHTLYITMEFIDGKNIRDITRTLSHRQLHLGIDQCLFLITEFLKGLDYAHRKTNSHGVPLEIIHRDISPQNIIVSYEGEVKILDFGIAKAASKLSKTEAGVLKGKFSYMSPEQASGKILDQRSDIYACGVIAHELLTSERLFRAKTDMETLERVKEGLVEAPSAKNPQIPKELDTIILKSLAKNPADRYQTAGEFLNELSRFVVQSGSSYNSQDLGAFMKTIFSTTIAEEIQRLNSALERVPKNSVDQNPHIQILNAKTRVAFKQNTNATVTPSRPKKSVNPDATLTVSKKYRSPLQKMALPKWIFLGVLIAGMTFFISTFLKDENSQNNLATNPSPSKTEEPVPSPSPSPVPSKTPSPPARVDRLFKPLEPAIVPLPSQVPVPSPLPPLPSPKPSSKPVVKEASPLKEHRPLGDGKIHVLPPPEGFASLFIDGTSYGTVPGPKARGIILKEGKHKISCQTKTQNYDGEISVEANAEVTIKCEDLREF